MPSLNSYFIKINKRKLTNPFNRILPFVITYHPAVKNLTQKMLERWSLMKIQPLLRACDDIKQKSKFLTDPQFKRRAPLHSNNRGENRLKEEEDEYT